MAIDFENDDDAKIVYDSIILELRTSPDYRSQIKLSLDGSKLLININAEDLTSFRASINSVIKWISLVMEIRDLVK
ncbi:MAG: hypothetical protein LBM96_04970 [Methanobrevibacter sp.]|nr:hypothetical protein [Candidatus Methanoflexus mossambicus]